MAHNSVPFGHSVRHILCFQWKLNVYAVLDFCICCSPNNDLGNVNCSASSAYILRLVHYAYT